MKKLVYIIICVSIAFNLFLGAALAILSKSLDRSEDEAASSLLEIGRIFEELALSRSYLADQKALSDKYKSEIDQFPDKLKKMLAQHDLELRSRDKTIAHLKSKIKGGNTVVVEIPAEPGQPKVISYDWKDTDRRFHLKDPDIFTQNDEVFQSNQMLSVKGWVFSDKDGKVQVQKIEITEVIESEDGKYAALPDSKAKIVESTFEYSSPDPDPVGIWDVINPKLYASFDTSADPGIGIELFNLGKLVPFANVGLGAEINPDLTNVLEGSLASSRLGLNATYKLLDPIIDSNLGIAVGISTPTNDIGSRWELTGDAIFYLTN